MNKVNVFMSSTSYPRTNDDWQGIFIRNIANALASNEQVNLKLWASNGPRHQLIDHVCTSKEKQWLDQLSSQGGIAHLIKNNKIKAVIQSLRLLLHLRNSYSHHLTSTDIFHVNWLQNALPLIGTSKPAVITVLGTDYKLLQLPGMITALRKVIAQRPTIIAPNAEWMEESLNQYFSDLCEVKPVAFGIDNTWYNIDRTPNSDRSIWIAVFRVTKAKIGPLFEWGESIFSNTNKELHLIGPNQENVPIPDWVHYHGSASPKVLAEEWFPKANGLITLSQHDEGRPQVMLEALASGLPIIASDLPAHTNFIEDYKTGRIVGDKNTFKESIEWILDDKNQSTISGNCREFAYDEYGTWQDCAERYLALYRKLLR
jgi:hypothetical protein